MANISVLFYDNVGHTDDDTDSLDVSADVSHGHGHHMPHVELVAPPAVEKKVEEKPQGEGVKVLELLCKVLTFLEVILLNSHFMTLHSVCACVCAMFVCGWVLILFMCVFV